jgi:hypothetical protein
VLFCYFDRFLAECESRFEKECGFLWPVIKEVVERYLDLVVFTVPRMLRIFFKYKRRLLGELCRLALRSLTRYFEPLNGSVLTPGIAAIQYGNGAAELERMDCLEFIAFLIDFSVVDRIINHLKLWFIADKPPTAHRLSGSSGGRRDLSRIFFLISSRPGRRGLSDFRRF